MHSDHNYSMVHPTDGHNSYKKRNTEKIQEHSLVNLQMHRGFVRLLKRFMVFLSHLKFSSSKLVLLRSIIHAISELLDLKLFQTQIFRQELNLPE